MNYQAALFDLDGTLVDSVYDLYLATNLTLSDFAFPIVSELQVRQWVGNGIDMLVRRALSGDFEINPNLTQSQSDRAVERFYIHYDQMVGQYSRLYPQVMETLHQLGDLPKALVTNKARCFTEKLLMETGLASIFDVLVCGDDTDKKPSPLPLFRACAELNVEPGSCIMVGDSKSDLLAAQRAGMDSIALSYGYNQGEDLGSYNPQYLCDRFSDIITPILVPKP